MEVQLTPDQEALVREAVESGRLRDAGAAAQEAFDLWEKRERRRLELIERLKEGEADFAAGRYRTYAEETLPHFFEEVKREARAARERG
jgi:Arc/MetJ-type ribon-helix-helix transcriptional regulator